MTLKAAPYVRQAAASGASGIGTTVVGTYGYMSPEQFRGAASPASDLYGLGGTLLFLLSGEPLLQSRICCWEGSLFSVWRQRSEASLLEDQQCWIASCPPCLGNAAHRQRCCAGARRQAAELLPGAQFAVGLWRGSGRGPQPRCGAGGRYLSYLLIPTFPLAPCNCAKNAPRFSICRLQASAHAPLRAQVRAHRSMQPLSDTFPCISLQGLLEPLTEDRLRAAEALKLLEAPADAARCTKCSVSH